MFILLYLGITNAYTHHLLEFSIALLGTTLIMMLGLILINNRIVANLTYILCTVSNILILNIYGGLAIQYLLLSIVILFGLNQMKCKVIRSKECIEKEKKKFESRSKEIELFAQVMTHDIKMPLQTIASICRLLRKDIAKGKINTTHHSMMKHVVASVEMAQDLVNSLTQKFEEDYAEGSVKKLNLQTLIQETAATLKYQIKKTNTELITDNLGEVMGDERALKTVFYNLINNAIKYQPKDASHPIISISHTVQDQMHVIHVKDNGIGINEGLVSTIFEPFKKLHSKSKYSGSGLGLFLCKSIVEKHRGTISATSQLGLGTDISIMLPQMHQSGSNWSLNQST